MRRKAVITKRCYNCGENYDIPNIRQSKAREYILRFYPCSHCNFSDGVIYNPKKIRIAKKYKGQTACKGCKIPFQVKRHHAYGYCNSCYESDRRHKIVNNATNKGEVI